MDIFCTLQVSSLWSVTAALQKDELLWNSHQPVVENSTPIKHTGNVRTLKDPKNATYVHTRSYSSSEVFKKINSEQQHQQAPIILLSAVGLELHRQLKWLHNCGLNLGPCHRCGRRGATVGPCRRWRSFLATPVNHLDPNCLFGFS